MPIYCKAFDLSVYLENTVRNLLRYLKYTLASNFREISRQIVRLIIMANSERKIATFEKVKGTAAKYEDDGDLKAKP